MGSTGKAALLKWCQNKTLGYNNVNVKDFSKSWQDGLAFCAIIHHYRPDLINYPSLKPEDKEKNLDLAFSTAEKLGIPALLDAEDIAVLPEQFSIITYLSQFYHFFQGTGTGSGLASINVENENKTNIKSNVPIQTKPTTSTNVTNVIKPVESKAAPATAEPTPLNRARARTETALPVAKKDVCTVCGKTVYIAEKLSADGLIFHKTCFRCAHCNGLLKLGNYAALSGKFYCKPHFKQLFATKGNYSEGFGEEKPTKKWLSTQNSQPQAQEKIADSGAEKRNQEIAEREKIEQRMREARENREKAEKERKEIELREKEEKEKREKDRIERERLEKERIERDKRASEDKAKREREEKEKQEKEKKAKEEQERKKKQEQEQERKKKQEQEQKEARERQKREQELREKKEKEEKEKRLKEEQERKDKVVTKFKNNNVNHTQATIASNATKVDANDSLNEEGLRNQLLQRLREEKRLREEEEKKQKQEIEKAKHQKKAKAKKNKEEGSHILGSSSVNVELTDNQVSQLEGYLNLKQAAKLSFGLLSKWEKKWFVLQDSGLVYYSTNPKERNVAEIGDIISLESITLIEPILEKPCQFKILTCDDEFYLQAKTEEDLQLWICSLYKAMQSRTAPPPHQEPSEPAEQPQHPGIIKFDAKVTEGYLLTLNTLALSQLLRADWVSKFFVLRNGFLLSYNSPDTKKYNMKIPLYGCTLEEYNTEKYNYTAIKIETERTTIVLRAESEEEMIHWMNALLQHKYVIETTVNSIAC